MRAEAAYRAVERGGRRPRRHRCRRCRDVDDDGGGGGGGGDGGGGGGGGGDVASRERASETAGIVVPTGVRRRETEWQRGE